MGKSWESVLGEEGQKKSFSSIEDVARFTRYALAGFLGLAWNCVDQIRIHDDTGSLLGSYQRVEGMVVGWRWLKVEETLRVRL